MSNLQPLQAAATFVRHPDVWPAFVEYIHHTRPDGHLTDEEILHDVVEAHRTLDQIIERLGAGDSVMLVNPSAA